MEIQYMLIIYFVHNNFQLHEQSDIEIAMNNDFDGVDDETFHERLSELQLIEQIMEESVPHPKTGVKNIQV